MSEKEDFIATLQACYFGDRNAFDKIVSVYDKLQQENKQLKENNMSMQEEMARTWKKADLYKKVIEEVRESIKDFQEYIDEAKKMYSDLDDDNIVKASCMQILNNQMVRNYKLLQILDKVKE